MGNHLVEAWGNPLQIAGGNPQQKEGTKTEVGHVTPHFFAIVHTAVPMAKARGIPNAKAAIDKEWRYLETGSKKTGPAWDLKSVQPRTKAIAKAKADGEPVHFGGGTDLCNEKGTNS